MNIYDSLDLIPPFSCFFIHMFAGYLGPSIWSPRFYAPTAWPRAGPFWNPIVKSHENRSHVVLG